MRRYALALDLIEDEKLIEEYIAHHKNVWPEIQKSILESGIENMEIFNIGNRLFMVLEVNDSFSFKEKAKMDAASEIVQEWEKLMWKYQKAVPGAKPGEKWVIMESIFHLKR